MHVVATAGHVDHGKSTLVRALTGMEPDRWAEERRRGMTIDLGFAWTALPGGEPLAFVDVPGHERFVPNMLAGVGPVPAVLLVVAADEGWMPQTAEHVAVLDALDVRHAVVAVTRSDLADPQPVMDDVRRRLAPTTLGSGVAAVPVSVPAGRGLQALVAALDAMVRNLPAPDRAAPVRLWIDRAFTIRGSGTVVTGTLAAGTLRTGDTLVLAGTRAGERPVRVRALQALGARADTVPAVARVAVNLRGVDRDDVQRGDALLADGGWQRTAVIDVRVNGEPGRAGHQAMLHIGAASMPVRVRWFAAPGAGSTPGEATARLRLLHPLPLAAGDRGLLRDPGRHHVIGRVTVLDVAPPRLTRRGAGTARGRELAQVAPQGLDGAAMLRERGTLRVSQLRGVGAQVPADAVVAGEWVLDPAHAGRLAAQLVQRVNAHRPGPDLQPGPAVSVVAAELGLPEPGLVLALARPPLAVRDGLVVDVTAAAMLPPRVARAVSQIVGELRDAPFVAPDAARLAELALGPRELAAAERAGALLRLAPTLVLLPDADRRAAAMLAGLPQPFTLSAARQALGTTRRVAVPLLELLDRRHLTRRLPDDRREVLPSGGQ